MTNTAPTARIQSIDLLRGIVMIIMALDHTRDYFHADAFLYDPLDLTQTNVALFFTRWITHFCAPVFVFLAGTSAFLGGLRRGIPGLSRFLLTRGLWIVFLEFSFVNLGWFFNLRFMFIGLQVIWAIGVSMVALSLLIRLPGKLILAVGLLLVFGHNLLDNIHVAGDSFTALIWSLLHDPNIFAFGDGRALFVAYPLIPWIGTMALGYCFGTLYTNSYTTQHRRNILLYLGGGAILLFVVLRWTNLYGDPSPWTVQSTPLYTFLSFLNTTKYPPSLLYLLMTLGPAILFLAVAEREPAPYARTVIVYGRVPMFYYLMHIYILHAIAVIAAVATGFPASTMVLDIWVSMSKELSGYGFGLGTVYLIWAGVVIGLYPLCRMYEAYKRNNREKLWLSYI
jgi:uncharacterized membrane protein